MLLALAQANIRVHEGFGRLEFTDQTLVHPVGLAALLLCCTTLLALPRRWTVPSILVMALLIPSAQRITVLGLDFPFLRVLALVGLLRVMARSEYRGVTWWRLDALVVAWTVSLLVAVVIRTGGSALEYQSGYTLDVLGGYFVFRCLVVGWHDVAMIAKFVAALSIPLAIAFMVEQATQHNIFHVFGGVSATTAVREGRLRCTGPYNHPILAGCIWASFAPLCASLWAYGGRQKLMAVLGVASSLIIVYCCASSSPVFGLAIGVVAFMLLPARRYLRPIRWGLLAALAMLHVVMKAPVWHLIGRVSAVGGSTGYHRYMLIDSFIRRFPEWALVGTSSTAHWFWDGQDLTNHFVYQGVVGGFLTFVLFVAVVGYAFAAAGRALKLVEGHRQGMLLAWGVGVSTLVHCACFIGVSYFGQSTTLWMLALAMSGTIGSLGTRLSRRSPAAQVAPRPLAERRRHARPFAHAGARRPQIALATD